MGRVAHGFCQQVVLIIDGDLLMNSEFHIY